MWEHWEKWEQANKIKGFRDLKVGTKVGTSVAEWEREAK